MWNKAMSVLGIIFWSPRKRAVRLLLVLCFAGACTARVSPWRILAPEATVSLPGVEVLEPAALPSSSVTCCINEAFYDCPDYDAGMRCTGDLGKNPLDPSRCRRDPSRDATCT